MATVRTRPVLGGTSRSGGSGGTPAWQTPPSNTGGSVGGDLYEAKDTSHITTSREAKEALNYAQSQAASAINKAPPGMMTASEYRQLAGIEQSGFAKVLSGLGSALEFIDRARGVATLAVNDFLTPEDTIPDSAYIDAMLGRRQKLIDEVGEELVGVDGRVGFSTTLDALGWEVDEDAPWVEKAVRGLASFGGEVALDPLTYVTFGTSAVGAKGTMLATKETIEKAGERALAAALRGTKVAGETAMETNIRVGILKRAESIMDDILRESRTQLVELPEDMARKMALERAAGKTFLNAETGATERAAGFVGGVVGEKNRQVLEAVTNRNFATLKRSHADYVDHVFTKRGGERLGHAFTTGGARLGLPFGVEMQSRPLKLTQGAFEKWWGLRTLHKLPQSKVGRWVGKVMPFVDADHPLIALARGRHMDDAAWSEVTWDKMNWVMQQQMKAGHMARNDVALTAVFKDADRLHKVLKSKGVAAETQDEVWSLLYPSLATGRVHPRILAEFDDEVGEAFQATVEGFSKMLGDSWDIIRRYSPHIGNIDNYVPLVFSEDFHRAMRTFREVGAPIDGEDLAAEAARLTKLSGEEISVDDVALFMEAYQSMLSTGVGKARVGDAAPLHRRIMGRYLKAVDTGVESRLVFLDGEEVVNESGQLVRSYADQQELNDTLMKVLRAVTEKPEVDVKLADDATALVTDPIKLLTNYVAEVGSVAEQRAFLNAARAVGAARKTKTDTNVDHLMFILGPLLAEQEQLVRRQVLQRGDAIHQVFASPEKPKKVSLGHGHSVEVPAEVAADPRIQRAVKVARDKFDAMYREQRRFQQRRDRQVKALTDKGISEDNARYLVNLGDEELITMRAEFEAAVDAAYDDMYEAYTRTWFEKIDTTLDAEEALAQARQHRDYLKAKLKGQWETTEDAYLKAAQSNPNYEWKPQDTTALLDPDDPVAYSATVEALVAPIRARMEEAKRIRIQQLTDEFDEIQKLRVEKIEQIDRARTPAVIEDKNKRYQVNDQKPLEGHQVKKLEAELSRLDAVFDSIADQMEALQGAKAIDDSMLALAQDAAVAWVETDTASLFAYSWEYLIADGLEAIKETNPTVYSSVKELWDEWFLSAVNGAGALHGSGLDQPRFWEVVAAGVRADWEQAAELDALARSIPGFEGYSSAYISYEEIRDKLLSRIEKLDAVASSEGELGALALMHDDPRGYARKLAAKLGNDLKKMELGDTETIDRYIVQEMRGHYLGQLDHVDSKIQRWMGGQRWNDQVVATERAYETLASAGYDQAARESLGEAIPVINRQLAMMPGDQAIRTGADGKLVWVRRSWYDPTPPFRTIIEAYQSGAISREALEENGLGFVLGMFDTEDALRTAREVVARQGGQTRTTIQQSQRAIDSFTKFMDLVADVRDGKKSAEQLRRFVYEGLPSGKGGVTLTSDARRIQRVLPAEDWGRFERLVQNVMVADPRVAPQGARTQATLYEDTWNRLLFQPLETTLTELEGLKQTLRQERLAAQSAEHQGFIDNAQIWLDQLTFIKEWAHGVDPSGTTLSSYSRRQGPQGLQSIEEAFATLSEYGRRLQHDGPFTYEYLVDDAVTSRGYSAVDRALDDQLRWNVISSGQQLVDNQPILKRMGDLQEVGPNNVPFVVVDLGDDGTKGVLALDVDTGHVMGGWIGDAVGVHPVAEGNGLGTYLTQRYAANRGAKTAEEFTRDFTAITEAGAAVINRAFGGGKVAKGKIAARELGQSAKSVEAIYGKRGVIAGAIDQAQQPITQAGMVDPAALGLGGIVDGYQLDPMAAAIFRNMIDGQKYLFTPEGLGELRSAVREVLDWWRPAATIARPNFHLRNAISGVANGLLIGVGPNDYRKIIPEYVKFRKALRQLEGGMDEEAVLAAVSPQFREVFRAAMGQDVLSTGFVRSDIGRAVRTGGPNLNPLDRDRFALFRAGGATMEQMEDVLRLTAFYKYYDEAYPELSSEFARSMVMMVHFDYQNLTQLERRLKPIAPFFVWTRRNVPLQLRALVEKPGYAQTFSHFSHAMNENLGSEEYRESPLPSFYSALAMPMGFNLDDDSQTWARFVFDPDLPLSNLEDLPLFAREGDSALPFSSKTLSPMAWVNWMSQLLGPQFAIPAEWIAGDGEAGYRTNAPAGINEIGLALENIDFFNLIDAEGQDWRLNSFQADLLNTAVPFFKDFTGAVENNPTRAARLGMDEETSWDERVVAEILALFGSGVGAKTQTPADAKSATFDAIETVSAIRNRGRERLGDNPLSPWE